MSRRQSARAIKAAAPAFDERNTASPEAVADLAETLARQRAGRTNPDLVRAVKALENLDFPAAERHAMAALERDETVSLGWHVLAIAREKQGELTSALLCYERALKLNPDHPMMALDLGRLAEALKLFELAERFYQLQLARNPACPDTVNSLAGAYRKLSRFAEAVELIRPALLADPTDVQLWNSLGAVMAEEGRMPEALTFYDEAVRLRPDAYPPLYNRANCKLALGDAAGAAYDCRRAIALCRDPRPSASMRFALAYMLLSAGQLEEGWDAYEVRIEPEYHEYVRFVFDGPVWNLKDEIAGKRLLVVGEQGLGDEVMFAGVIPDALEALGPEGRLILAVEPRLVALMQRSFPEARVLPHGSGKINHESLRVVKGLEPHEYDTWTHMGRLLRRFRAKVEDFPARPEGFLKVDPERVAHWRETLATLGAGPKVGIIWKSMKMSSDRSRYFSPFEGWRPVLDTPGVTFLNLQYGDCAEELAQAKAEFGIEVLQPPGIDLKNDLDELAALCLALDLNLGPATATTNIAAAAGAATWFISTPDAWPRLGTDRYPWYAQARVFASAADYGWGQVMAEIAGALRAEFPAAA